MGPDTSAHNETHRGFRFARFVLDLDRATLAQGADDVKLRPQAFKVLAYLLDHHGCLVEKRELIQAIWGDAEVTEDSLTHCIIDIRKAIGDVERKMIATVPRLGFRFDAPTERIDIEVTPPADLVGAPGRRFAALALLALVTIALSLFSYLSIELTTTDAPQDRSYQSEAVDHYTRARFLFDRRSPGDVESARDSFLRAIDIEPEYARAWAGLAGTYALAGKGVGTPDPVLLEKQKTAAERAVALDASLADGWIRLADYYSAVGDGELASRYRQQALAVGPDNPLVLSRLAGFYAVNGEIERAVRYQRRALAANPLSFTNRGNLSFFLLAAGHYNEALAESRRLMQMRPEQSGGVHEIQGFALIMLERYQEALALAADFPDGPERYAIIAMAKYRLNDPDGARAALAQLVTMEGPNAFIRRAEVFAFCEELDRSFAVLAELRDKLTLEQAAYWQFIDDVRMSPFLASLREDRRWAQWVLDAEGLVALRS